MRRFFYALKHQLTACSLNNQAFSANSIAAALSEITEAKPQRKKATG
jgi:hypothetical protein